MSTHITTEGNLTATPEARFTQNGRTVANLRIAVNDRRKGNDGEYFDTEPVFYEVTVWGHLADNAVNSLAKGDRITATGQHYVRTWTDKNGDKRTSHVIDRVTSIGASLQYATASLTKATRTTTATDEPPVDEPPYDPYDA